MTDTQKIDFDDVVNLVAMGGPSTVFKGLSSWLDEGWNPFLRQGSPQAAARGQRNGRLASGWGILTLVSPPGKADWLKMEKERLSVLLKAAALGAEETADLANFAASRGETDELSVLIKGGVSMDAPDESGTVPMMRAWPPALDWIAARAKNFDAKDKNGAGIWERWAQRAHEGSIRARDMAAVERFCKPSWNGSAIGRQSLVGGPLDVVKRMLAAGAVPADFGVGTDAGIASAMESMTLKGDALQAFSLLQGLVGPKALTRVARTTKAALFLTGRPAMLGRLLDVMAQEDDFSMFVELCGSCFFRRVHGDKAAALTKRALGLLGKTRKDECSRIFVPFAQAYLKRGEALSVAEVAVFCAKGGFLLNPAEDLSKAFDNGSWWAYNPERPASHPYSCSFEGLVSMAEEASMSIGVSAKRRRVGFSSV